MQKRTAIEVERARTHNLKGIDCRVPHRAVTVVTGPSGAGKSSLAFDTIFAEGQRRFVESMSTYARQFLDQMERPPVDAIHNILPAVALEAKNAVRNARSTVGTITETLDVMRLLFTHLGEVRCVNGHGPVRTGQPGGGGADLLAGAVGDSVHPGRRACRGRRRGRTMPSASSIRQGFQRRLGDKGRGRRSCAWSRARSGRRSAIRCRSSSAASRPRRTRRRAILDTRRAGLPAERRPGGGARRGAGGWRERSASTAASSPARSAASRPAGRRRPSSPSTRRSAPARSARGSDG